MAAKLTESESRVSFC